MRTWLLAGALLLASASVGRPSSLAAPRAQKPETVGAVDGSSACAEAWQWISPSPQGADLKDVVFVDGIGFVAVGNAGAVVVSRTGVGWLWHDSAVTDPLYAVGYGNGTFVAVGARSPGAIAADRHQPRRGRLDGPQPTVAARSVPPARRGRVGRRKVPRDRLRRLVLDQRGRS